MQRRIAAPRLGKQPPAIRRYTLTIFLLLTAHAAAELLFNLYLTDLGYREDFIGVVNAVTALVWGGAAVIAGMLANRWTARRVLIAGALLFAAGFAARRDRPLHDDEQPRDDDRQRRRLPSPPDRGAWRHGEHDRGIARDAAHQRGAHGPQRAAAPRYPHTRARALRPADRSCRTRRRPRAAAARVAPADAAGYVGLPRLRLHLGVRRGVDHPLLQCLLAAARLQHRGDRPHLRDGRRGRHMLRAARPGGRRAGRAGAGAGLLRALPSLLYIGLALASPLWLAALAHMLRRGCFDASYALESNLASQLFPARIRAHIFV